jgi:hypothetical protein
LLSESYPIAISSAPVISDDGGSRAGLGGAHSARVGDLWVDRRCARVKTALVRGSKVSLNEVLSRAPGNWYIQASEAKSPGLVSEVL